MDLLGQMPSPASLPQLEAAVLLPFGLALAVGPFWAALVAVSIAAVVWLWRASSSSPTAAKTVALTLAVSNATSRPKALFPLPAASSSPPASQISTSADEKSTGQAPLPALVGEHEPYMRSSSRKVKWVYERPEVHGCVLAADEEEFISEDTIDLVRSWDGIDGAVYFSDNELMGLDEDISTIRSWVTTEALRWSGKGIGKGVDLGWYAWQDRTVISGSVVRLWDGERSPRRRSHTVRG